MSFTTALALALSAAAHPQLPPKAMAPPPPPETDCDTPVLMVIAGPTRDPARMRAYGQAIADSKLYEQLGGYYLNIPSAGARFEGEAEQGYTTLIVRFPCLANAKAFWYSDIYQRTIRPLRLNPSAGDYVVRVYSEAPVRSDMADKVGDNAYLVEFDADAIEQVSPVPPGPGTFSAPVP